MSEGSSNHQWGGPGGGATGNLEIRPSRCSIIGCNTPRNAPSLSLSVPPVPVVRLSSAQATFLSLLFSLIQLGPRRHGDVKSAGERPRVPCSTLSIDPSCPRCSVKPRSPGDRVTLVDPALKIGSPDSSFRRTSYQPLWKRRSSRRI